MKKNISFCFNNYFKSKMNSDIENNQKIFDEFILTENNLLKCKRCEKYYVLNTQINTLKKHYTNNHLEIWNTIKKKVSNTKSIKKDNEKNIEINNENKELQKLVIEFYDEILKLKNQELDELKNNIKNGNLDLLDLLLQKQNDLGNFEGRHKQIINKFKY
jgi:anti-sigma28 factor (negative regulator of flagellin synthesis)